LALKHALAYIRGTTYYELVYQGREDFNPVGYINSDYAGCKNICQSTEGNIFIVAEDPVSWESK